MIKVIIFLQLFSVKVVIAYTYLSLNRIYFAKHNIHSFRINIWALYEPDTFHLGFPVSLPLRNEVEILLI